MSRAFYLGGLSAALLLCFGTFAEAGLFFIDNCLDERFRRMRVVGNFLGEEWMC